MPWSDELSTPAAVVDLDVLERNAARMRRRAETLGVALRPHVKTHACVEAARIQCGGGAGPITVATLAQARAFAEAGFGDVTLAVPLDPAKLPALDEIRRRTERLSVILDTASALREVTRHAEAAGRPWSVFLEVDCGQHRSGVDPEARDARELAARLHASEHVDFRGLLTHAGQSYRSRDAIESLAAAERERDVVVRLADELRAEAVVVPEVSVGSTPTMTAARDLSGVTEIRPGNYAFFDVFQAAIGSCSSDDVALSVLSSVTSVHPDEGRAVLDAGAIALSKDPGPTHVDPQCGFGRLLDAAGAALPGLRLASLSQEHGLVGGAPEALRRLEVGARVRIQPNHSCLTAAQHDALVVVRGDRAVEEWRPVRGW